MFITWYNLLVIFQAALLKRHWRPCILFLGTMQHYLKTDNSAAPYFFRPPNVILLRVEASYGLVICSSDCKEIFMELRVEAVL